MRKELLFIVSICFLCSCQIRSKENKISESQPSTAYAFQIHRMNDSLLCFIKKTKEVYLQKERDPFVCEIYITIKNKDTLLLFSASEAYAETILIDAEDKEIKLRHKSTIVDSIPVIFVYHPKYNFDNIINCETVSDEYSDEVRLLLSKLIHDGCIYHCFKKDYRVINNDSLVLVDQRFSRYNTLVF